MKQHFRETSTDLSNVIDRLDELSDRFLKDLLSKHDYSGSDRAFNKAAKMADRKALKVVKNSHFIRMNRRLRVFRFIMSNANYCCSTKNHLVEPKSLNIYSMIIAYRHEVESNNPGIMVFDK